MASNPCRRWYRFCLRTLLVFVTIAGLPRGWLGYKVRLKQQERAAILGVLNAEDAEIAE